MVAIAEEALAHRIPPEKEGFRRYIIPRAARHVVLVIAPWNYPYLTAVNTIVPGADRRQRRHPEARGADAAGRRALRRGLQEGGLPKGLFQNLVLSPADREADRLGPVDHVASPARSPAAAPSRRRRRAPSPLGLELGGKDPAYVRADAKLDHAVENLVDGAFFNSGQCCCGIERIYVHEDVYDDFVEGFRADEALCVGNPLDQADHARADGRGAAADFVRGRSMKASARAPKALIDDEGRRRQAGSPYLAPEVLTGVNHQMEVMREESFGPVVGIMKVRDDEEAIS
jgi:acyl-CoA reductase-like NAD-dependent aldehyde dehydrogenase